MKRATLFAILLLVLGFVTTVAVAWFYAGVSHPVVDRNRLSDWTSSQVFELNGWIVREWTGSGKRARLMWPKADEQWQPLDSFDPPHWSRANQSPTAPVGRVFEDERGWPFLSFRCTWQNVQPFMLPDEPIRGGVSIRPFEPDWMIERSDFRGMITPDFDYIFIEKHRALPLIPVWPGLIGSTLVFSGTWAVVLFLLGGIAGVRRWRRRRRHCCIRCCYSLNMLESANCPECGWRIGARPPRISGACLILTTVFAMFMIAAAAVLAVSLVQRYEPPGPLHVAAATNDVATLRRLLHNSWNVDERLPDTRHYAESDTTPLEWACARGQYEAAEILLDAGADFGGPNGAGVEALQLASRHRHDAVVRVLLDRGASVVLKGSSGPDVLSTAAAYGTPETLRMLLQAGAEIDRVEGSSWSSTALGSAAGAGRLENMRLLLDAGASVNPPEGIAPLMRAIEGKHADAAKLLLEQGAATDASVGSLLWEATEQNQTEIARWLIAHGADPNMPHPVARGWTPLRRAVVRSNLELAKMIVAAGGDPFVTDDGETLLFHIDWNDAPAEMFEYLLSLGIDINQRTDFGQTVLMQEAHSRHADAVRRLLAAGADPTIENNQGLTALDYAEKQLTYVTPDFDYEALPPDPEVVQLLRDRLKGERD